MHQFRKLNTSSTRVESGFDLSPQMWLYYRNARICYAYIDDVSNDSHPAPDTLDQLFHEELRGSRWFTRAWTLQELIAPSNLTFYNVSWTQIGSRDRDLLQLIYEVTKIPKDILSAEYKLEARLKQCSIAKRMSWAAERRSRRPEDRAYSLMGIFAINMPMLYGEGTKAFVRLQEEIIKTSTDHSILVHANLGRGALFASGPSEFLHASNIDACDPNEPTESYSMTNRGLIITLPIITNIPPRPGTKVRPKIVAALNCREKGDARMILLIQSTLPPAGSRLPLEYSIVGNLGTTAVRTREEDKRTIVIIRECLPKFD